MDIVTLSSGKGYTNQVALGLSNISIDNKKGIVTFTLNDGSSASWTFPKPLDGKDGVSIVDVIDKGNGIFTLLLSDGTETSPVATIKGQKGDPGQKGNPGYTPIKGVDYWTEEDKASIVADVIDALPTAESGVY